MTAASETGAVDVRNLIEAELTVVSAQAARLLHHPDCKPWLDTHTRLDHLLDQWRSSANSGEEP